MAHQEQKYFFNKVKEKFPSNFDNVKVLDFGSLNVNGSLFEMFTNSEYIGIDIVEGSNVNVVSKAHEYTSDTQSDTIVSGEMLEHDEYWVESLKNMYSLCKNGGLIAISCAGKDRPEHGTERTGDCWGTSNDYYMNVEPKDIKKVYKTNMFSDMYFEENTISKDTYFYGIKK